MHTQVAHKIALHQPEGLGDQERVRSFPVNAVNHLTPELDREGRGKILVGQGKGRTRLDSGAASRWWKPKAAEMLARQGHGGVKADQAETPGNGKDQVAHGLSDFRHQEVKLSRVVPGHMSAIVAMIDIAVLTAVMVMMLKDHCRITVIPVTLFNANADPLHLAQVRPAEIIGWIGGLVSL